MSSFVDSEALRGSDDEREEEQLDEYDGHANGDVVNEGRVGPYADSSEEDEGEDDDEEAARAVCFLFVWDSRTWSLLTRFKVREGFIVDEDEETEHKAQRRREKKKRRREEREREDEHLDEEDLELIGAVHPGADRTADVSSCMDCRNTHC